MRRYVVDTKRYQGVVPSGQKIFLSPLSSLSPYLPSITFSIAFYTLIPLSYLIAHLLISHLISSSHFLISFSSHLISSPSHLISSPHLISSSLISSSHHLISHLIIFYFRYGKQPLSWSPRYRAIIGSSTALQEHRLVIIKQQTKSDHKEE